MIIAGELRTLDIFAQCGSESVEFFAKNCADIHVAEGEWVLREGESPRFFVLISGTAEILKNVAGHVTKIGDYDTGAAFGEVPLLLGSCAMAGIRATSAARLARVDQATFWQMMHRETCFAHSVLSNMSRRVAHVQQVAVAIPQTQCIIEGDSQSPACHELRDFLTRMHIAYEWDERAGDDCDVRFTNRSSLHSPTVRELAEHLDLSAVPHHKHYDVAIVGGGPAGLAAAVYGASEGLRTLLIDRFAPGGQAGMSSRIENYLGFPAGISGEELADRAFHQAQRFGADIVVVRDVRQLSGAPGDRRLTLDDGQTVLARAVVLAPGVAYRMLTAHGCDDYLNHGVFYGAAQAEAVQVSGKDIHIVGGGNSAGQAALHFSAYARSVTIAIRADDIGKDMSQYLVDQVVRQENVRIVTRTEVDGVTGSDRIERICLRTVADGDARWERSDALFVFIGAVPQTDWLGDFVARDERGYLLTGPLAAERGWPLSRQPYLLETNQPGVFAVGDAREGSVKRVAAGVGEGSSAIAMINAYLRG